MKTSRITRISLLMCLLAVAASGLLLSASGCNAEQIAALKGTINKTQVEVDAVEAAVDRLEEEKVQLDTDIVQMPPGKERERAEIISDKLGKVIDAGKYRLGQLDKILTDLETRLADANDAWDVADAGVKTAAPFIPAPWGPLVLATWGAVMTYRSNRHRAAGRNLARSVDSSLGIEKMTDAEKAVIRSRQSPLAARIVDEAQGNAFKMPL